MKSKKLLDSFVKHKKYWLLATVIIMVFFLFWLVTFTGLAQAFLLNNRTNPGVAILGVSVGNLDENQLNEQLTKLKTKFESQNFTLTNDKDQWGFVSGKLGVTFDVQSTSQSIWNMNKGWPLFKRKDQAVAPVLHIDNQICSSALSTISIPTIEPQNASIYYNQGLKIRPEQAGVKFNAASTCDTLFKRMGENEFVANINLDATAADISQTELESKLPQIQALIDKPLTLKSGSYQLNLKTEDLLLLIEISKVGSDLKIDWSSVKLDELVESIAAKINTYTSPQLGACQYTVSSGGNWLDKEATKNIFKNLNAESLRSYNLSVSYHAPAVGTYEPVVPGNKGTVYLTFDDGLIYGNQIMNYASCFHVKVTFFEIGSRVGTDAAALRRAIAEGHAVQSHGYEHAAVDYGTHDYNWQYNDMLQSINAIMGITGVRPTYFRPPGGNRSANTYAAASANGLKVILWGATSSDSAGISSSAVCSNVLSRSFPGASVLMHSSKPTTANAFPCIVKGLAARGYNFQVLR